MPELLSFQTELDPGVLAKVRSKHAASITSLKTLGFQEFLIYRETTFPGAILVCPLGFLPLVINEVAWVSGFLRVGAAYPLFISSDGTTLALSMKLGVMFFTFLNDGWTVQSANYKTNAKDDKRLKISKRAFPGDLQSAWRSHLNQLTTVKNQVRSTVSSDLFDLFKDVYRRQLPRELLVGSIIGWIIAVGLFRMGLGIVKGT